MTKIVHVICTLLFSVCTAFIAHSQVSWASCLGGPGNDRLNDIIQLKDGNLIGIGETSPNAGGYNSDVGKDFWVVKFKPNGDTIWARKYGSNSADIPFAVMQLNDCNILICGLAGAGNGDVPPIKGDADAWVLKIDPDGNIIWSKTFGGTKDDWLYGMCQDANNNIFLVGTTFSSDGDISNPLGSTDCWLIKLDLSGNLLLSKCYGGTGNDRGYTIINASNGQLMIGGESSSTDGDAKNNHGRTDWLVLTIDTLGNVIWSKCFGGTQVDYLEGHTVVKINENLFALAGSSTSSNDEMPGNYGCTDYRLVTIDSSGNLLTSHNYGGSNCDYATSLVKTPDGNCIILGESTSNDIDVKDHIGSYDFWMVKVDMAGKILYSKSLGTQGFDQGDVIINTLDYGYVVGGFSEGNYCGTGNRAENWLILKLDHSFDNYNDSVVNNDHSVRLCNNDSVLFNGSYISSPGIHYSAANSAKCDSGTFINIIKDTFKIDLGKDTSLCKGDTITLNAGLANSYLWSNDSTSQKINVFASGIYWVQASDGKCQSNDSISISFKSPPVISLGNDTTLCTGQTLKLNGGLASSYLWSNDSTTQSINVSIPGIYWLKASNASDCFSEDSINVSFKQSPVIDLGNDTTLCSGNSITLYAGVANTYLWSNGSTSSSIVIVDSGTYWVRAGDQQCSSTDSINISFNTPPVINLGNDTTICKGEKLILNGGKATTYQWSNGSADSSIIVSSAGIYWVRENIGLCPASDSINIAVNPSPVVNLGRDTALCFGDSLLLNAGQANTYIWSTGATSPSIAVSSPGTYWVQAGNGTCYGADSINILFDSVPVVNLGNDTTVCQGATVALHAGQASTYLWSNGSTASSINVNTTNNYWVTDYNGNCKSTDTVFVLFKSLPVNTLISDTTLCNGKTLLLNAGLANSYLWSTGATTQNITVTQTGEYNVIINYFNVCTVQYSATVKFAECGCEMLMPTAFTPNNDGKNDIFRPANRTGCDAATFTVYNRWGRKVFETSNVVNGWDGYYNGVLQGEGVYVWQIIAIKDGKQKLFKGTVTLIR